jgi:hypothetical protein
VAAAAHPFLLDAAADLTGERVELRDRGRQLVAVDVVDRQLERCRLGGRR